MRWRPLLTRALRLHGPHGHDLHSVWIGGPGWARRRAVESLAPDEAQKEIAQMEPKDTHVEAMAPLRRLMGAALVAVAALCVAPNVRAATWEQAGATMTRLGSCGTGAVRVGDGCTPVPYANQPNLARFGQALEGGIFSNDTDDALVVFTVPEDARLLRLTVKDFRDQRSSFGRIELFDGRVLKFARTPNGTEHVVDIELPRIRTSIWARFVTALNDGFTVRGDVCRQRRG